MGQRCLDAALTVTPRPIHLGREPVWGSAQPCLTFSRCTVETATPLPSVPQHKTRSLAFKKVLSKEHRTGTDLQGVTLCWGTLHQVIRAGGRCTKLSLAFKSPRSHVQSEPVLPVSPAVFSLNTFSPNHHLFPSA